MTSFLQLNMFERSMNGFEDMLRVMDRSVQIIMMTLLHFVLSPVNSICPGVRDAMVTFIIKSLDAWRVYEDGPNAAHGDMFALLGRLITVLSKTGLDTGKDVVDIFADHTESLDYIYMFVCSDMVADRIKQDLRRIRAAIFRLTSIIRHSPVVSISKSFADIRGMYVRLGLTQMQSSQTLPSCRNIGIVPVTTSDTQFSIEQYKCVNGEWKLDNTIVDESGVVVSIDPRVMTGDLEKLCIF